MGVPQPANQKASNVSACVCAAGILAAQDLTGCRVMHPTVGEAALVWPDPGLLLGQLRFYLYMAVPSTSSSPGGCILDFLPLTEHKGSLIGHLSTSVHHPINMWTWPFPMVASLM